MVSVLHGVLYMVRSAIYFRSDWVLKHLWSDEFLSHYDRIV